MQLMQGKPIAQTAQRVLVVDDEPMLIDLFRDVLSHHFNCKMSFACSVRQARDILASQEVDLLVADVHLPDGSGLSLLNELYRRRPSATALVVTGEPSVDGAITALRQGAIDFLPKPFSATELTEHVRLALDAQQNRQRREDRMRKLRDAVRKLSAARRTVNKKVDLLCNDLIHAYSELSRQFDTVRIQQGFRSFIDRAPDLEQLLCHTMDWLLRQIGYCNIGIWLASAESELQLGAFMKYTVAADPELTEAVQKNLLHQVIRRGFLRMRDPEAKAILTPQEQRFLAGHDIMGVNCTYLGECLGTMLLFRDQKTPFSDDDVTALKTVSPLFALALARAVKGTAPGEEAEEDSDNDDSAPPQKQHKPKGKTDPADWWKRGEAPPF